MPLTDEQRAQRAEYNRQYAKKHRDRIAAQRRARYAANPDKVLERQRAYRRDNDITARQANPEQVKMNARARRAKWREVHKEKNKEIQHRYWHERGGREQKAKTRALRRAADADVQRLENVKYRLSRVTGIPMADLPAELVEAKMAQVRVRSATRADARHK